MQNDWIKTQAARNIVGQFDERRPAWLWSGDGQELIWRNHAGRLFLAKQKKGRVKPAKDAVPIKGQVRRLLRLGSIGLSSLARVQFLVGNKPVSATCSCMPVVLENNKAGLLIVGVDPIEAEIFTNANLPDIDDIKGKKDGNGKETGQEAVSKNSGNQEMLRPAEKSSDKKSAQSAQPAQPAQLSNLLDKLANNSKLFDPLGVSDETIPDELKQAHQSKKTAGVSTFKPETGEQKNLWRVLGAGFRPAKRHQDSSESDLSAAETHQPASERQQPAGARKDKAVKAGFDDGKTKKPPSADKNQAANALKDADLPPNPALASRDNPDEQANQDVCSAGAPESESKKTSETSEEDRVASYNFKELSRILKNRINGEASGARPRQNPCGQQANAGADAGKTLNLSEEMLVLNRLPIGILIFKDQKILFANRAFATLMGSSSISRLHEGGLGGLFPRIGNPDTPVGPVVSLVKLDGKEVLVDARLQTITWHARPALMLSASKQNSAFDGEASIKSFTRSLAENKEQGYFETNDAGIIGFISQDGARLLGQSTTELGGSAISLLIEGDSRSGFQDFLRQKAQFAGAARPHIELECAKKNLQMEIFSEGRAGIVTGYFGIIRPKDNAVKSQEDVDNSSGDSPLLARLSRGIRRPLNTILGFSELIYSEAFGALANPRYGEYARDIKSAGGEIARLVDEMDEYSRLKSTNFVPDSADFDLGQLLDECLRLVRVAANKRRVFVRSAISETLPGIFADRASMRQAILNLLASAIDQTPAGGKVILSAQIDDDGSIGVHVRDSAQNRNTTSERFVVFSESNSRRGDALVPMKSSMGLALTRSLLAVNECALHVDPSVGTGTLMSLSIPAVLFAKQD